MAGIFGAIPGITQAAGPALALGSLFGPQQQSGLDKFLGSPTGGALTGGVSGALGAIDQRRRDEEQKEELERRRRMEQLQMIQNQSQNNFGNTMQLALAVQQLAGRQGGFG